jgi:hypothetical protein
VHAASAVRYVNDCLHYLEWRMVTRLAVQVALRSQGFLGEWKEALGSGADLEVA